MHDKSLAYFLFRLLLGINLLMHGIVRLPELQTFVDGLVKGFEGTLMPVVLVPPFAYCIPFVEGIIGLLLILGLWTRQALVAGFVLMALLLFGKTLQQDWATVGTQMIYVIILFFLLFFREYNSMGLDAGKRRT